MKKLKTLIFIIMPLTVLSQEFYYYQDSKIDLIEYSKKAYIQLTYFDSVNDKKFIESKGWQVIDWIRTEGHSSFNLKKNDYKKEIIYGVYIQTDKENLEIPIFEKALYQSYFYLNQDNNNIECVPSPFLYVELKSLKDSLILKQKATDFGVEILGNSYTSPEFYILRVKQLNRNPIEVSRKFKETNLFNSCEPDIIGLNLVSCSNDPLFASLWGLKNIAQSGGVNGIDIKACNAWNITTGSNDIITAVIDQGIVLNHEDLSANVIPLSFNTMTNSSPSGLYGDHGTHVAGTIAAIGNNSKGIVGVAPNSKLMSISNNFLLSNGNMAIQVALGFDFARVNNASIINNSYYIPGQNTQLDIAISNAVNSGRNGLGSIVIFATGNDYNSSVRYPANSNPDILAVGAVTRFGMRSSFSNYDSTLDVVAPGSDILSSVYNNGYAQKSGTSMAAPHVSGLAALILSLDPCLTVQEVNDIIESTAQKVGGYNYTTTSGRPNGVWNNEMGYGLIDAEAALQEVLNQHLLQNETVTGNLQVNGLASDFIRAGENVNPLEDIGGYIISSGVDVEFKATQSITLDPGFTASSGSDFLAHIEAFNGNCNQWNSKNLWFQDEIEVIEASTTESISVKEVETASFFNPLFFPNPYNEALYVKYDLEKDEEVVIQLFDFSGRTIYTKTFQGHSGQNMHLIDFSTEAKVLIAKTCVNGDCKTAKLIKGNEK